MPDDTKNGCVTHYVHMNPDKNMPFQKWSDSCELGLSWGGRYSFEAYAAGSECEGALWVVVPLCRKNLWKEAVAHFKYRRLHKQHSGPTHKNQSFITHDLICIWSFLSVLTIFIDWFIFFGEISYPDGGTRAKNSANKNRRGLGRAALTNPPHFIARPTFGFRPRFTMWTLGNKLVLNFVVCLASLRQWKDSMQFFLRWE